MQQVISVERIKQIIKEEIQRKVMLDEGLDLDSMEVVFNGSKSLLAAAYKFKENASPSMINATTPILDQLISKLEEMLDKPSSYALKQNPKISSKPQKINVTVND